MIPNDGYEITGEYNPSDIAPIVPKFPTPSGVTKDIAVSNCTKAIHESKIVRTCAKTVHDLDTSSSVDQCVFDIMVIMNFFIQSFLET